jgi:predicted Fe-S protein YdhL (DUF1289 family)
MNEIANWMRLTESQKRRVIAVLARRRLAITRTKGAHD